MKIKYINLLTQLRNCVFLMNLKKGIKPETKKEEVQFKWNNIEKTVVSRNYCTSIFLDICLILRQI